MNKYQKNMLWFNLETTITISVMTILSIIVIIDYCTV